MDFLPATPFAVGTEDAKAAAAFEAGLERARFVAQLPCRGLPQAHAPDAARAAPACRAEGRVALVLRELRRRARNAAATRKVLDLLDGAKRSLKRSVDVSEETMGALMSRGAQQALPQDLRAARVKVLDFIRSVSRRRGARALLLSTLLDFCPDRVRRGCQSPGQCRCPPLMLAWPVLCCRPASRAVTRLSPSSWALCTSTLGQSR